MVQEAKAQDTAALSGLCEQYWFPLYGFARRLGYSVEDAKDLTQDFFHHFLANKLLDHTSPGKGRMRSFLLTSFRNHATSVWRRENRQKRGGGVDKVPIDVATAEERLGGTLSTKATAEHEFDRLWARELMARALKHLEKAWRAEGKEAVFEAFRDQLTTGELERSYREIGDELGMTEAAARYTAYTLRARYREALEGEVLETVGDRREAAAEFAHLQQIFCPPN